jgi:DNA-binding transcriptional ArsR family regulator
MQKLLMITELTGFLKSLSDPTRLRIVEYLSRAGNPRCVSAISKHINVSQSATSQHLRILRQSNIVKSERRGYFIHYELNTEAMDEGLSQLQELLKK